MNLGKNLKKKKLFFKLNFWINFEKQPKRTRSLCFNILGPVKSTPLTFICAPTCAGFISISFFSFFIIAWFSRIPMPLSWIAFFVEVPIEVVSLEKKWHITYERIRSSFKLVMYGSIVFRSCFVWISFFSTSFSFWAFSSCLKII